MNYIENLTRYVANFVDELAHNGLTDVVISPGSRSTPLAMLFAEHSMIKEWVVLDERSAAFFGLGLAKKRERPVAILCSSGTATANYFPAIVEAYHSRVPLIVLTADRPHELRDVGAPQAIDQIKLYGDYVKWFKEMALPEGNLHMLNYVRSHAARSFHVALAENPGPVHLNFPLREPLVPDLSIDDLWGQQEKQPYIDVHHGIKQISESVIQMILEKVKGKQRGLIVVGPQTDAHLGEAISLLSEQWGIPVLADPLSQIRSGSHRKINLVETYDAFLRNNEIRKFLAPDFIIRFGAMPVSKAYLFFVKENPDALQLVVEPNTGFREPTSNGTEYIYAEPSKLCSDLIEYSAGARPDNDWLNTWMKVNDIAKEVFINRADEALTEGEAVRTLLDGIPHNSSLYVGNSMAVRDVDTFLMGTDKEFQVHANRGANGIDGMISSAMGVAATGEPTTLLLGDLSFYHDMNGLLVAKHYGINITILLINNNGGGIFSFLPQAKEQKHFEALFGTPVDLDFKQAVNMYGGNYYAPTNEIELLDVLERSYHEKGLSVIEVKTDRTENAKWHRELWTEIERKIINTVIQ